MLGSMIGAAGEAPLRGDDESGSSGAGGADDKLAKKVISS